MSLGTILLIVSVLVLIGVIPAWPHSRSWGYAPSGVPGSCCGSSSFYWSWPGFNPSRYTEVTPQVRMHNESGRGWTKNLKG